MARGYASDIEDDEEEGQEGQSYQPEEESYGMTPGWSAPTERGGFAGLSVGNTPARSGYMPREGEGGYEPVNEPYQPGVSHGYQMPEAGEQADAAARTGLEGIVPPLMNYGGQAVLKGNDGQPIMSGGQPVTLDQYHRAFMASQPRQSTMTPEQQAAAAASGKRWAWGGGPQDDVNDPHWLAQKAAFHASYGDHQQAAAAAGQAVQAADQRQQQLQGLMEQVQQNAYLSPAQRSQAMSHLFQQMGQVAQHGQAAREVGQRTAAVQAGLAPNYGMAGGPELDPRLREQLQQAEYSVQQVRDDPKLSMDQKVTAIQALSKKINQLDPAGRYRNGQQPMSPIEKAMAQTVYHDEDKGIVYAYDPKTGRVTPHFEKAEKAAKQAPQTFDDLPLKEKDDLLHKEMQLYGIGAQQAMQQIRQRHAAFGGGGQQQGAAAQTGQAQGAAPGARVQVIHNDGTVTTYGGGQPQQSDAMQALDTVQRHLMGDPRVDTATARKAYDAMPQAALWQVHEAAGDVGEQMQQWEQRRRQAAASGMPFSMPDRATVAARAARASAILAAPIGQGGVPTAPQTIKQQQDALKLVHQQAQDATKTAKGVKPDYLSEKEWHAAMLAREKAVQDQFNHENLEE